jgi:hypothetical protein
MAHDASNPLTYTFAGVTVRYAGQMNIEQIHQLINGLTAQASRLAPKVADQALESCCTTTRPTGPRAGRAWDLVAEGFAWNAVAGILAEEREAKPTPKAATACSHCGAALYAPGQAEALCRDCQDEVAPYGSDEPDEVALADADDALALLQADVIDQDGTNVSASRLLDVHHDVVGERDREGYLDNCERCGFATGWQQPTVLGPDAWGHATQATSAEVLTWLEAQPAPEFRCPECDTYSGHFSQQGDEVCHSTCGRVGSVASFTRGTPEYDAVYDHQEAPEAQVTDAQLQAAFLAARQHGVILSDEVLRDILLAAQEVTP